MNGAALRRAVLRNAGSQVLGRALIALCRLAIAGMIVRLLGAATFGEYALVFGLLSIVEWLADFGTTDVFIRDVCREPARRRRLLDLLAAMKLVQVPLAFVALAALLLALDYPRQVVGAGLVGGLSLGAFAVALVYRVLFRARLAVERDVAAEFLSVVAMLPLVALTAVAGGGLVMLFACHVASRIVYAGLAYLFGREAYRPSLAGVSAAEVRQGLTGSATIGAIGFLVVLYETTDVLVLSKLAAVPQLAFYSAAQRLAWPVLLMVGAIAATLYPVAAAAWPESGGRFARAAQRGVDVAMLLAGVAASSLYAGASFYVSLLGSAVAGAEPVLRVFAALVLVKPIAATLGPLLYIVHAQRGALRIVATALAARVALAFALAPAFGALGVACGALAVELVCGTVPMIVLVWRRTGYRLGLSGIVRTGVAAGASAWCAGQVTTEGLVAALVAPALFVTFAFALGAIKRADMQALLARKVA